MKNATGKSTPPDARIFGATGVSRALGRRAVLGVTGVRSLSDVV